MKRPSFGGKGKSRMTLRVSRDSGRTWGPSTVVREGDGDGDCLPKNGIPYPPCYCPRCTGVQPTPEPSR
ncbi:exo-alpha-sialidase [Streptomyces clavuligerus]|uniref:Exo-alpha-sialidase n=1 Tax=Streptomyces clavuligerus TaxID=1901 RepID=B5GWJ6_STRCL|nr:exo-alpha-sialidase [Streptomyces clavuligerus]EDY50692.1 hypothetical protein SSCG_03702 [Streptomyces clavuligerus]EFG07896.1 Hypothetical protein SCLAV_2823 [Streptomyces clavuligerus]QCS06706.1 exo-alpha-sialidase [Streptomyces clavuligerus]QPJ93943.1 exo-alpha-sialidase [Streptomyces clavuligerus]